MTVQFSQPQLEVFQSKARFRILVAGRRFGKTFLGLAELLRAGMGGPNRLVWYVGPNDHQSKRIAWRRLKEMTKPFWAKKPSETELRIDLENGSMIVVNGAFAPNSLRGDGLDFLVMDEFATLKPEAWHEVFRPALSDKKGRALFIGTPKGRNHFYDLIEYAETDKEEWEVFRFTTEQGGRVDAAELQSAARQLDPEIYKQEFCGEFTAVGRHRVYYAFQRADHVKALEFDVTKRLIWSIDFNVNPMIMLLMQKHDEVVHVLEEIVIQPEATTEIAFDVFEKRAMLYYVRVPYYHAPLTVEVHGDASGHQKRTVGAATDWILINRLFGKCKGTLQPEMRHSQVNPPVRDRVNIVNSRLRNQLGEVRLFIDPQCKQLIKDLEQVVWGTESNGTVTGVIDKSDRMRTHASDALGYYLTKVFSLKRPIGDQNTGPILSH